MEFWKNRYTVPGWIFVGVVAIYCRDWLTTLTSQSQPGTINIGLVALGIFSGLPLGFIVYSFVEFIHRSLLGGNGRYINFTRLERSLATGLRSWEGDERTREALAEVLDTLLQYPTRITHHILWFSLAKKSYREACQRRWEAIHVYWACNVSMVLAVVVAALAWYLAGDFSTFFATNKYYLAVTLFLVCFFQYNANFLVKQVSQQENFWVDAVSLTIEKDPQNILSMIASVDGKND